MRRRGLLLLVIAVVGLAGIPTVVGLGARGALVPAGTVGTLTVPTHIGVPWPWTPTVGQSAPRRATMLFAGSLWPMQTLNDDVNVTVVGGASDVYRLPPLAGPAAPGENVLLSPDGARVAYGTPWLDPTDAGVRVVDLDTNQLIVLRPDDATTQNYTRTGVTPARLHPGS